VKLLWPVWLYHPVVSISDTGTGTVISVNGQAEFVTRYCAIVFKPLKGEVVDGIVYNVTLVRDISVLKLSYSDSHMYRRVSLRRLDL
jgi:DNA-directed RNA polymerase subunit E'/Rpb7